MARRELLDLGVFPMLRTCSSEGCRKVVFGGGTCIDHDAKDGVPHRQPARAGARVPRLAEFDETVGPALAGVEI
jgi:hypothetical protein